LENNIDSTPEAQSAGLRWFASRGDPEVGILKKRSIMAGDQMTDDTSYIAAAAWIVFITPTEHPTAQRIC